jgi:hypothetical protein
MARSYSKNLSARSFVQHIVAAGSGKLLYCSARNWIYRLAGDLLFVQYQYYLFGA